MKHQPLRSRLATWYSRAMVVIVAIFIAQLYSIEISPYLNLRRYALGQERMPFQARELMRYPMLWAGNSGFLQHHTAGRAGMNSPERLVVMLSSLLALLLSIWATQKIDRMYWPKARVPLLPFAVLIVVILFSFYVSASYAFPYDLPSMMFIGWGLYFLLSEQFWWLLLVFAIGTWNRETTLFLVFAAAAIALMREGRARFSSVRRRDILQIGILSIVWCLTTGYLHHKYRFNPTEAGPRISSNLVRLTKPVLWPTILSGAAFLMPWIYWRRDLISAPELRACVLLLPFWVLILLSVGLILEVRIYGDISVFIAVCAAAILRAELGGETIPSLPQENTAAS